MPPVCPPQIFSCDALFHLNVLRPSLQTAAHVGRLVASSRWLQLISLLPTNITQLIQKINSG